MGMNIPEYISMYDWKMIIIIIKQTGELRDKKGEDYRNMWGYPSDKPHERLSVRAVSYIHIDRYCSL